MMTQITDHEPKLVWKYFSEISAIPRESGNEKKAIDYLQKLAETRGYKFNRDDSGNIVIKVPGSKGYEKSKTVIMQAHIDMVCVKTAESNHDFHKDGIELVIKDGWLKGKDTTLGADDGIGVAASLAIMDDPDSVHPPLEICVTVDEEVGMTGAMHLNPGLLTGRTMINLDSMDLGIFYIGCAGGGDCIITFPTPRKNAPKGLFCNLRISGLAGGHSGLEIIKNSANANKLLARVLYKAIDFDLQLVTIKGGTKRNVIPSEAHASFVIPLDRFGDFKMLVEAEQKEAFIEFQKTDPDMRFDFNTIETKPENAIHKSESDSLIRLLMALPHGTLGMSRDVANLVETSNNMGIVDDRGDFVTIVCTHRSSVKQAKLAVRNQIIAAAELAGASVAIEHDYPGWKPNIDSPVLKMLQGVHQELFGNPGTPKAVHAGLETGLLLEKIPNLDIVSFGPQVEGAHSVEERMDIESVQKFYKLLKSLLAKLADQKG
jgi:dipeptidase D